MRSVVIFPFALQVDGEEDNLTFVIGDMEIAAAQGHDPVGNLVHVGIKKIIRKGHCLYDTAVLNPFYSKQDMDKQAFERGIGRVVVHFR